MPPARYHKYSANYNIFLFIIQVIYRNSSYLENLSNICVAITEFKKSQWHSVNKNLPDFSPIPLVNNPIKRSVLAHYYI